MSDGASRSLKDLKLFPRNLTAHADTVVRGNPVTTRPESGVENSFPGLEFDQRNIDKVFFGGLLFEFHHDFGVILRDFDAAGPAGKFFEKKALAEGVFLVFLQGRFASRALPVAPRDRVVQFTQPAGLEAWRLVRDLEPGPVAVALCDLEAFEAIAAGGLDVATVDTWFKERKNREVPMGNDRRVVLLFAERSRYLTAAGVIDPKLIPPGDLTRSLCSPWQYDFADCGCFYWASNKPDLVSSDAQPHQVLNFQRKDRSPQADKATEANDWLLLHEGRWDGEKLNIRHAEMLARWSELPFVIAGKETTTGETPGAKKPKGVLSREDIIRRLQLLAPVEHALAVEYLYAFYSLNLPAPMGAPSSAPTPGGPDPKIVTAGQEVFQVAVDEMRHFRAVNELLALFKQPPVLGRARIIGEDFDGDGKAFNRPFALVPLTTAQLDWFIDVERASPAAGDDDTIDGMYTHLLSSIRASTEFSDDDKARFSQLIKTIIDEGVDHFGRFLRVKKALHGLSESSYLRVKDSDPKRLATGHPDRILQDTLDASYVVVLRALDYAFRLGDQQRGAMVEASRRAMYNMDDAARSLAARGVGACFDSGPPLIAQGAALASSGLAPDSSRHEIVMQTAREVGAPLRAALVGLRGAPGHAALADRMEARLATMTREFEALMQAAPRP